MSKTGSGNTMYADYLKLDAVLAAQQALSDHPDEMQFIIVHQVHELWFKLALTYLDLALAAMQAGVALEATRRVMQVVDIIRNLRGTTEHLHTLPPSAFHAFRKFLAPGSGMQSFQFHEIEFALGRRDEAYLKWVENSLQGDRHLVQIAQRLSEPSLAEAFDGLMAYHNIPDCATLYGYPERYPEMHTLADALSMLEHQIILWRQVHIQLVERTIGVATMGTGGTTHDYLQRAAQTRFFPALWEGRNELSRRVDAGDYGA